MSKNGRTAVTGESDATLADEDVYPANSANTRPRSAEHGTEGNPLPNNYPQTLALAYLHAKRYARIAWIGDNRGVCFPHLIEVFLLRYWREDFFVYQVYVYRRIVTEEMRADLARFLNLQFAFDGNFHTKRIRVTKNVLADCMMQLSVLCQVHAASMPAWLGDEQDRPAPCDVVPFQNGLLDLPTWLADPEALDAKDPKDEWFHKPTPNWFSVSALPRPYSTSTACPETMKYLKSSLVTDDQVQLALEFIGYLVSGDNSFEKMLWFHGLAGGGKGTGGKLLSAIVGEENVVSFDLSDLTERFTLNSWVGKKLAIARDAHLGEREKDAYKVTSTLLAIAGRDPRYIDRKNKDALPDQMLQTRIVVAVEKFPKLPGAEGGIRRRSLILSFDQSHDKKPDRHLFDKMKHELSGVTSAGLAALRQLHARGSFTKTRRSEELIDRLFGASSSMDMFIEETFEQIPIVQGADGREKDRPSVLKRRAFAVWEKWRLKYGEKPLGFNTFCERIYEACPDVRSSKPRVKGDKRLRSRSFQGLEFKAEIRSAWASDWSNDSEMSSAEKDDVKSCETTS